MDFWKAYFTIVEVLKSKVALYEDALTRFGSDACFERDGAGLEAASIVSALRADQPTPAEQNLSFSSLSNGHAASVEKQSV